MKDYHYCSSCKNYEIIKTKEEVYAQCSRLKFRTMKNYKFDCWDPNERTLKLLLKDKEI